MRVGESVRLDRSDVDLGDDEGARPGQSKAEATQAKDEKPLGQRPMLGIGSAKLAAYLTLCSRPNGHVGSGTAILFDMKEREADRFRRSKS